MGTSRTIRLLAAQLAVLAAFAVTGCNVFNAEGAACAGDANCPGTQVCCSGKCERTCSGAASLAVSATLATDYVPGYEFDTVIVQLDGQTRSLAATPVTDLLSPRPIGQFADVRSGRHTATLTLSLQGNPLASRAISFSTDTDITLPFVLTRDCAAINCGAGQACIGGKCVASTCSALDTSACPPDACSADRDCQPASACSTGVCMNGVCLQRRLDADCADDERCVPGIGCVVAKHECDVEVQCDDLASCTQERCVGNRCVSTPDDTRCGATVCNPAAKTADLSSGCTPTPCNSDNCTPGPCEVASCGDDGQCNRQTTCQTNEQCCAGVCATNCNDPRACAGRQQGYVCRVAVGACDIAEVCDGVNDTCPADARAPNTTVCRDRAGDCDVAEMCDGISGVCPPNILLSAGTVCRNGTDICDAVEMCTGQSGACPVDVYQPQGTLCRAAAGPCDVVETCTGTAPACPGDGFHDASVVCRAPVGACDAAETCPGNGVACPADIYQPGGTVCRPSAGSCDIADTCTGSSSDCPGDAKSSAVCRDAASACDVAESCDGVNNDCPANGFAPTSVTCASAFCAITYCDGFGTCAHVVAQNGGASCDANTCAYCTGTGSCSYPDCQGANECVSPGKGAAGCRNPCPVGKICP